MTKPTRRDFLLTMGALAASSLVMPAPSLRAQPPSAPVRRPNIVVIFTDDHGYADLSCQNSLTDIKTPNIDALARDGLRMTSGYATAPPSPVSPPIPVSMGSTSSPTPPATTQLREGDSSSRPGPGPRGRG